MCQATKDTDMSQVEVYMPDTGALQCLHHQAQYFDITLDAGMAIELDANLHRAAVTPWVGGRV